MFDKTSRSIYEQGLRFYEEDILFDSHVYHANQRVVFELDYVKNGVGLMIGLLPGQPLEKQQLYYFVRLDSFSSSVFLVNQMHFERLRHVSTPYSAPVEHFKIEVEISPNQISLSLNDKKYMYVDLDYSIGDHHLGIYSQKDNTFYHMYAEGQAPKIWRVNMQGAQNGRIGFGRNLVNFSDCKYPAELLQEDIILYTGKYYLNYEGEGVTPYIFDKKSSYVELKHKNILKEDNSFEIEGIQNISLYFSGKNGFIKNISISRHEDAPYIETFAQPIMRSESCLKIKLDKIQSLTIDFNVLTECFGTLLEDILNVHKRGFIEGNHSLIIENGTLTVYYNNEYLSEYPYYGEELKLFQGFEIFISRIHILNKENEKIDWFQRNDKSDWIKPSLNSPILATNEFGAPLDLSASFRYVSGKYIFTNTERETFVPYPILKLSKPIMGLVGAYGIPKSSFVNESKFYNGLPENMNDISAYCETFEPILECTFDKELGQVVFHADITRYKEIIIDYKKQNSYCINFVSEIGQYSVQTTADHYSYFYSVDEQEQYAKTLYKEIENYYVVLEKEEGADGN